MVRLLVNCQPRESFKPGSGRSCSIRSLMVRAVCLPVIGFAVMGPPACNRLSVARGIHASPQPSFIRFAEQPERYRNEF